MYVPRPTPASFEDFPQYLNFELQQIADTFSQTESLRFAVTTSPPTKLYNGLMLFADGQGFNPNSEGKGLYVYLSQNWNKIA